MQAESAQRVLAAVQTVAVVAHPHRSAAHAVAADVITALTAAGCRVIVPSPGAPAEGVPGATVVAREEAAGAADLVVCVGGDGTLLRAFVDFAEVPLVGVHCGELGYLAEVRVGEIGELARRARAGELVADTRATLDVVMGGRLLAHALNDVVVDKRAAGRVIKLEVDVDGETLTTFRVDGVIASTPTGSTAYNFSAGGPVVDPGVDAFLITPVAPHALWDRSLVLPPQRSVQFRLIGDRRASVLADGRPVAELAADDVVEVGVSARPATLVRWAAAGVASRLRSAFGWGAQR
ncbi:MAG: NAD(+)/NADH kinase [Acidimicrobiia bacterium]